MKMDRIISIIMILLERKRVSVPELAKICEVTPRTIQRDLEAINMAGVPVVSFPGLGGGVGIMENYKLEKRLFSTADVAALLMGLGSIRSSLSGDEVVGALAKIKGMIPEEHREAIELKAGQLTIDTTPWMGGHDYSGAIALIQTAMDERRLLKFAYKDRKQNSSLRTVEPYRLILKTMNWYFEGFCLARRDFRIFKLSRMADVLMLEERYEARPFSPEQSIQPVFEDKHDAVPCTLRVREAALEPLTDLFGPDCVKPEPESGDTWIAAIPFFEGETAYKFLLGFGQDCEILAPESLRSGFKRYLDQISSMYTQ